MGGIHRKLTMSTQEWCEYFYNKYVFAPLVGQTDPWRLFCQIARQQILDLDPAIAAVDVTHFSDQMLPLRLEVIGIAWFLHVKHELSPMFSECTRLYLVKRNREQLWDMMEPYNRAVARSTVGGSDPATRTGRAHIAAMNSMRFDTCEKWLASVADPKDATRSANRLGCDVPWKSHKTHIYLSFALTDQLQCEVNEEARQGLMVLIQGFFDGTTEELHEFELAS